MVKFKYKEALLTEDQIKQRCRFLKIPYIKGEYQENYRWRAYAAFKWWHKKEMDKRVKELAHTKKINQKK